MSESPARAVDVAAFGGSTPLVMGVLNVTPDSFSDGGEFCTVDAAVLRARQLVEQGARLIDVGGESTRPGAERVPLVEEQRRVLPVIEALRAAGITTSIDTVNSATARHAVAAGASFINDVSGGTADPEMRRVAAETGAGFIIMHWRGIPDPSHGRSRYRDVVAEVKAELAVLADAALAAGVRREQLVLDPGLGFDKTAEQGWQLLSGLDELASLGYPLLIGASRKRMLAETLADDGNAIEIGNEQRDFATAAVSALVARAGVWGVRVHEVASTAAAIAVGRAWARAEAGAASAVRDRITLTGLEVFAYHGVFGFEREQGQRFVIDAELTVDLRQAASGDELSRTVHYGELATALVEAARRDPVDLIETLAERLAQVALSFDGTHEVRLTVHKPDAPIEAEFADVSVTVVRSLRGDPAAYAARAVDAAGMTGSSGAAGAAGVTDTTEVER